MDHSNISILFPYFEDTEYKQLTPAAAHDLGLDAVCRELSEDQKERRMITNILTNMTSDKRVALYRQKVFADILAMPELRKRLTELFDRLEFLREFGGMKKATDEKLGIWYLMHRLDELDEYISCVEEIKDCLDNESVKSEGLVRFREHITSVYDDHCFAEMKKDIAALKLKASDVKSVTVGINVNERFEATSVGLISVNSKQFRKSGIVSSFADAIAAKGGIKDDAEWDGTMHYHEVAADGSRSLEKGLTFFMMKGAPFLDERVRETVANVPDGDGLNNSPAYLEKVFDKLLDTLVKKLRDTLSKYVNVAVVDISKLIPEFVYYIRMAEFVEKKQAEGFSFCEAQILDDPDVSMRAKGIYNLRLAVEMTDSKSIVTNDLDFDTADTVYILTGANRGGKTTITQAVGQLFLLAQGGIYVPADSFEYRPADCIFTHFPADEDKTLDLGRLGEECVRFRELYSACTSDSLVLLNESFSTTSFEEGCFIAKDSVRALLGKSVRTIYNTHMHKLAEDIGELNSGFSANAASLVVKSEGGSRSFKAVKAPPEGLSYARDIAEKYGVTYEMLTSGE